jgi:hypothetical protein
MPIAIAIPKFEIGKTNLANAWRTVSARSERSRRFEDEVLDFQT